MHGFEVSQKSPTAYVKSNQFGEVLEINILRCVLGISGCVGRGIADKDLGNTAKARRDPNIKFEVGYFVPVDHRWQNEPENSKLNRC
jgi:hypothetical protein